jgi:Tfp pilus assembly protein PilV
MKFAVVLLVVLVLGLSLVQFGCNRNRDFEAGNDAISKILIDDLGDIWLNSRPSSLALLDIEFARLKKVDGVVWYYQKSPSQAARASGAAVLTKASQFQLQVRMCSTDDPCRKVFEP